MATIVHTNGVVDVYVTANPDDVVAAGSKSGSVLARSAGATYVIVCNALTTNVFVTSAAAE